jgi:hypothetical protein
LLAVFGPVEANPQQFAGDKMVLAQKNYKQLA